MPSIAESLLSERVIEMGRLVQDLVFVDCWVSGLCGVSGVVIEVFSEGLLRAAGGRCSAFRLSTAQPGCFCVLPSEPFPKPCPQTIAIDLT